MTERALAGAEPARAARRASFRDYVSIARPDHWIKHIFIIPGIALAELLRPAGISVWVVLTGFASAAAIASANYTINEWLDAEHDAHHPIKSKRPAVASRMAPGLVWLQYCVLGALGLVLAARLSGLFLVTSALFLVAGLIYNVPPVRAKDLPYVDVLVEALNNPIRLTLGWAMVDAATVPPGSLLLAYWMGGAYLMSVKRLAERRTMAGEKDVVVLARYRKSFAYYTPDSLLLASFLYALMASFFLAVFLIKYRIEYLLALPFFAGLFVAYLKLGLRPTSPAQTPEKLLGEKGLLLLVFLLSVAMVVLTLVDLPFLEHLTRPHFLDPASLTTAP